MHHIPADQIDLCVAVANAAASVRALVARIVAGGERDASLAVEAFEQAANFETDPEKCARLRALAGEEVE